MIDQIVFYILTLISLLAVIIPMIRNDHWTFRALEFPRIQKFIFVLALLGYGVLIYEPIWYYQSALFFLIIALIHIGYHVFPFTPLAKKTLKSTSKKAQAPDVRLLIYNVLQDNDRYGDFLDTVKKYEPDMVMMVEADQKWLDGVDLLNYKYSHSVLKPLGNTYGMLLFSQLKLAKEEIRYLVKDEVPSIKTKVELEDGRSFWFFGLHPEPPSPTENEYSTARDRELMKLAEECSDLHDPIIVAGDLNDVAWSYTTTSFIKESGLYDPRKGRGFYSTFHTRSVFMRWPLDHVFCSEHFELVRMKKLKNIGSDHFPILIELMLK
jgi:endonuclease/exonuclease/phosphatase (EEP) superfamily protein YafD